MQNYIHTDCLKNILLSLAAIHLTIHLYSTLSVNSQLKSADFNQGFTKFDFMYLKPAQPENKTKFEHQKHKQTTYKDPPVIADSIPIKRLLTIEKQKKIRFYLENRSVAFPKRVFEQFDREYPCFNGYENFGKNGTSLRGLIYIRVPKASSSTLAGINLRISSRRGGNRRISSIRCATTWDHVLARNFNVLHRNKSSTFLYTFLRDPAKRLVSNYFYFTVSRDFLYNRSSTLEGLEHASRSPRNRNYQLKYVSPNENHLDFTNSAAQLIHHSEKQVQAILEEYNFIGLTERFDESLVVLKLLLGLDTGDILYISSNVNGGYDKIKFSGYEIACHKMTKSYLSPKLKEYFMSDFWHAMNIGDYLLYKAANKSLDLSIKHLGTDKFQKELAEFRHLKSIVTKTCETASFFPCTSEGVLQMDVSTKNCYMDDFGCGFPCLNKVYKSYLKKR